MIFPTATTLRLSVSAGNGRRSLIAAIRGRMELCTCRATELVALIVLEGEIRGLPEARFPTPKPLKMLHLTASPAGHA